MLFDLENDVQGHSDYHYRMRAIELPLGTWLQIIMLPDKTHLNYLCLTLELGQIVNGYHGNRL